MEARPSPARGSQTDGNHDDGVDQRFDHGGETVGLDDGQHLDAGAGVVVTVEPGDGHEVRELPDEEDGEEGDAGPLDLPACGGPAEERAGCAGEGSRERWPGL
jgi:hypothetical protein